MNVSMDKCRIKRERNHHSSTDIDGARLTVKFSRIPRLPPMREAYEQR